MLFCKTSLSFISSYFVIVLTTLRGKKALIDLEINNKSLTDYKTFFLIRFISGKKVFCLQKFYELEKSFNPYNEKKKRSNITICCK